MSITSTLPDLKSLPLSALATLIRKDWPKVNYAAEPYLKALESIESINDNYYLDTARSVVLYFLSNASTWRGETAKLIKAELKRRPQSRIASTPPTSVNFLYRGGRV